VSIEDFSIATHDIPGKKGGYWEAQLTCELYSLA
jgi:hypothetical protein